MNYPAKEGTQPARHQMLTSSKIPQKKANAGPDKKALFDKQAANLRAKPTEKGLSKGWAAGSGCSCGCHYE